MIVVTGQSTEQELSSCRDGRPFGHNRHGPKRGGGAAAPFHGGAGSPSNTMWPASIPSDILIHPAVWPQHTWAVNRGQCPFLGESWVPI